MSLKWTIFVDDRRSKSILRVADLSVFYRKRRQTEKARYTKYLRNFKYIYLYTLVCKNSAFEIYIGCICCFYIFIKKVLTGEDP